MRDEEDVPIELPWQSGYSDENPCPKSILLRDMVIVKKPVEPQPEPFRAKRKKKR